MATGRKKEDEAAVMARSKLHQIRLKGTPLPAPVTTGPHWLQRLCSSTMHNLLSWHLLVLLTLKFNPAAAPAAPTTRIGTLQALFLWVTNLSQGKR